MYYFLGLVMTSQTFRHLPVASVGRPTSSQQTALPAKVYFQLEQLQKTYKSVS